MGWLFVMRELFCLCEPLNIPVNTTLVRPVYPNLRDATQQQEELQPSVHGVLAQGSVWAL